jgi:hypothetical protein
MLKTPIKKKKKKKKKKSMLKRTLQKLEEFEAFTLSYIGYGCMEFDKNVASGSLRVVRWLLFLTCVVAQTVEKIGSYMQTI